MVNTDILKEIGLLEEEIKVYMTLLKIDSSLASNVAKKSDLERSLTYKILGNLIKKGFVSYVIKNNVKYFSPVSPNKIIDILKDKQEKLEEIIPELNSLFEPKEEKPIVEIFEGIEGIKTILKDILKIKQEWFAFGSGKGPETLSYYVEHWEKERVKNKILMKAILDSSEQGLKRGKNLSKLNFTEVKYSDEKNSSPSSIWIYGNRVAVITWTKEYPFAIRTISKEVSTSYKNYFNALWKAAKK
ncbi:MAG: helix-turn-helix domain-containing protein [Candidatus Pacearchaeota archaeon]